MGDEFETVRSARDAAVVSEARRWIVTGRVQGVGFRPFVYRLAKGLGLAGWVQNQHGQVEIRAQGPPTVLDAFAAALIAQAPPLARPWIDTSVRVPVLTSTAFDIRESEAEGDARVHVPPDYFACDACLAELGDPRDRRYRYPFINCTQCGPRYTLIRRLPYDRPNTALAGFGLCPACAREYRDPADRRFHAEPTACPVCGPTLSYVEGARSLPGNEAALVAAAEALRAGRIVAVKGVGGYHLMCDARNGEAIARLRARKRRPDKPFAVMFPASADLRALRAATHLDADAERVLRDPMRPILLVAKKTGALPDAIAPGLDEIGVMLPYSPLHHLLLDALGGPLIATSANISGEPVLTEGDEVERRLGEVADVFLHHDRPIERPADDPVFRVIAGCARPLRLGRGVAPLELSLPFRLARPMLAVGGHMKNSVALAWDDRVVMSPHIGDMGTARSLAVFERVVADLQALYGVRAQQLVCDAHRDYATTRWVRAQDLPVSAVYHHHAHAAGLAGEHPEVRRWLVFTWDGVGYGEDGTLWGGETLYGCPGAWRRVGSMRPFHLTGGDRAAREPWRSACALAWETGAPWPQAPGDVTLLHAAWQRRMNTAVTSAVGRLFDAAAALTGLVLSASYEGQGPMSLEAVARAHGRAEGVALPLIETARGWETDWAPLVAVMRDETRDVGERAAVFHASLALAVRDQAHAARARWGIDAVGLTGGVFQNRRLTEEAIALLDADGVDVRVAEHVPMNDGGLCYGQIIETGARDGR